MSIDYTNKYINLWLFWFIDLAISYEEYEDDHGYDERGMGDAFAMDLQSLNYLQGKDYDSIHAEEFLNRYETLYEIP